MSSKVAGVSKPQNTGRKRLTPEFQAQAGKGRPKGRKNRTTIAMKEAIMSVYADLQDDAGGDNAHFKTWAEGNPTEFYKIAAKLIPLDLNATITTTPAYTVDDWVIPTVDDHQVGHA